jgi:hypothetical protein
MDSPQQLEAEFNRIYDEEHVPNILKVPGPHTTNRHHSIFQRIARDGAHFVVQLDILAEHDLGCQNTLAQHATPGSKPLVRGPLRVAGSRHSYRISAQAKWLLRQRRYHDAKISASD